MDYLTYVGLGSSRNPLEVLKALFLPFHEIICFLTQISSPQTRLRIRDRERRSSVDEALAHNCGQTFPIEVVACPVVHSEILVSLDALVVM